MADRQKLSEVEVRARLPEIPGWELVDGKLHRTFRFASFVPAFGFMASVALVAEAMNHHPDWANVYNRVIIDLNTHDVGGISTLDFTLARRINEIAG
jgi:4a-hydroxytetrahydrobiopterin dehydratase